MRFWPLAFLLALSAGCKQQDVDGLGRIGRKLLDKTQAAASPLREKFDNTIKGIGAAGGLKERVQQRLQFDKALSETSIEVRINNCDIDLRGKVKTDEQRRRAIDLTESTIGVERVTDQLQIE